MSAELKLTTTDITPNDRNIFINSEGEVGAAATQLCRPLIEDRRAMHFIELTG